MPMRTVVLTAPIDRDGSAVTEVAIRAPRAGELRGLSLYQVMQMDATSLIKLLPRITEPALSENELANLPVADLTALGVQVLGFFEGAATFPET